MSTYTVCITRALFYSTENTVCTDLCVLYGHGHCGGIMHQTAPLQRSVAFCSIFRYIQLRSTVIRYSKCTIRADSYQCHNIHPHSSTYINILYDSMATRFLSSLPKLSMSILRHFVPVSAKTSPFFVFQSVSITSCHLRSFTAIYLVLNKKDSRIQIKKKFCELDQQRANPSEISNEEDVEGQKYSWMPSQPIAFNDLEYEFFAHKIPLRR